MQLQIAENLSVQWLQTRHSDSAFCHIALVLVGVVDWCV